MPTEGASAMQPACKCPRRYGSEVKKGEVSGQAVAPVYEEKFWKKRVEDVPVRSGVPFDFIDVTQMWPNKNQSSCSSTNSFRKRMRKREQRQPKLINAGTKVKILHRSRMMMTRM